MNDGGPAFPTNLDDEFIQIPGGGWGRAKEYGFEAQPGMSLRDWFAGQALAGLCANPGGPFQANGMCGFGLVNCSVDDVGEMAKVLADATLKALHEVPDGK